jgi:hypothetical protein
MKDQYISRGGTLGGHHKFRTNVTGALGSEMFNSAESAGKAFRKAHFDAVHEYTRQMMKMEVGEKLNLALNHPDLKERFPNTTDIVEQMKNHALNTSESFMQMKGMKRWLDTFYSDALHPGLSKVLPGLEKHPEAHVFDLTMGKLTSFFYHSVLMMRPSFWVAQASQSAWALRSMVKSGIGPIDAQGHMALGMKQLVTPDEEFLQGLFHHTQQYQTFSPEFIHDLNQHGILELLKPGSKAKTILSIASGEKPAAMADTLSRVMSYAALHEHFKALGYKGEELFQKAGEATDENMVQYGNQWKAPIFKKLGVLGDLLSPLQAFSTASFGNIAADFRYMLKDPDGVGHIKAAMPLMATFMITALMGGAIGIPFAAEYEAVADAERAIIDKMAGWTATAEMMNYISKELGMSLKMPSLIDVVLSGDNTFSHRVLSHGLVSASTMPVTGGEGFDMGSSLRYAPLFNGIMEGKKTWVDLMPAVKFDLQQLGYAKTLAEGETGFTPHSDAEMETAALGMTPGYLKGVVSTIKGYNDNPEQTTTKGQALVPLTTAGKVAKYLGTTTIPASVERLRNLQITDKKMKDSQDEAELRARMIDALQHNDKTTVDKLGTEIAVKYHRDGASLNKAAKAEIIRRTIPEAQRRYVGTSGKSTPRQKQDYKDYMDVYGDNPYKEDK